RITSRDTSTSMRLIVFSVLSVFFFAGCGASLPKGAAGPNAEALTDSILSAVNAEDWRSLPAVRWNFRGDNLHVWDKEAHRAFVRWDDYEAWIDIDGRRGRAREDGQWLEGEDASSVLDEAHAHWVNDSFWLNPLVKIRDPGTERFIVDDPERGRGLLVRFREGGRTPGDAYLWWLDGNNRPVAWQMWVSNVPIGGFEASWEAWLQLEGGAWVSTFHDSSLVSIEMGDVAGGSSPEELGVSFEVLDVCPGEPGCAAFDLN
ncbi:MAG: hypothetical protein AAF658_10450, partial [Myxococcota bacterium]